MAGTNLYWGRGEGALRELAEARGIPVFLNGLARGCLPADHELFFSRARGAGLKGADLALVIGVPMDFRLGFGASFGEETELVVIDVAEPVRDHPREVAAELYGDLGEILSALADAAGPSTRDWVEHLRGEETAKREAERAEREDDRAPLHPMRLYAELAAVLDRDAIVIGDGGDFVSYAGRVVDSYAPGCWLDPGPFGCLGSGPGYALAAKLARPERQVVLMLGDGAFGFSGHGMGHPRPPRRPRRRGHGQQRHLGAREAPDGVPLRLLAWPPSCARRPATTRSSRPSAGDGELVREPGELRGALERALEADRPGPGERADRPDRRLPEEVEPRLERRRGPAAEPVAVLRQAASARPGSARPARQPVGAPGLELEPPPAAIGASGLITSPEVASERAGECQRRSAGTESRSTAPANESPSTRRAVTTWELPKRRRKSPTVRARGKCLRPRHHDVAHEERVVDRDGGIAASASGHPNKLPGRLGPGGRIVRAAQESDGGQCASTDPIPTTPAARPTTSTRAPNENPPAAGAGGFKLAPSGRAGVRALRGR